MSDVEPNTQLPSEACSISKVSQIIIHTSSGPLCNFCFEICSHGELPIVSKSFQSSETCSCSHKGPN